MKIHKLTHRSGLHKYYSYESSLCNWAGLVVSMSLIVFFLFMKACGLYEILAFRYFNFIFLLFGIVVTFHDYRKALKDEGVDYLTGIKMGLRITLTAVIPFAIFVWSYLTLDSNFMGYIKQFSEFGSYLTPVTAAGAIAIEGVVSGGITTFIAMQYFKRNGETED